jgi:hypothetical protein
MILTLINKEKTSDLLMSATMQHLNKFAVEGLRTLCIAYKNIDPTYSDQWMVGLFSLLSELLRTSNFVVSNEGFHAGPQQQGVTDE